MTFIPRDPVNQSQFLVHDSSQGDGTESAGAVVYLSGDQLVAVVSGSGNVPFGFLMQNVKAESSAHPTGFRMPGDLGSSDAFTGDPVGVAHLGLYDTTYYDTADTFTAGDYLGASNTGRVSKTNMVDFTTVSGVSDYVAIAQNTLDATAVANGDNLRIKLLI